MNGFYISGKLDQQALRTAAVWRCLLRYGVTKEWAVRKITERGMTRALATAVVEMWLTSHPMKTARQQKRDLLNWKT